MPCLSEKVTPLCGWNHYCGNDMVCGSGDEGALLTTGQSMHGWVTAARQVCYVVNISLEMPGRKHYCRSSWWRKCCCGKRELWKQKNEMLARLSVLLIHRSNLFTKLSFYILHNTQGYTDYFKH